MSDLLTVAEVARILGVGEDTVTRRFSKIKGVIDLGTAETPKKRRKPGSPIDLTVNSSGTVMDGNTRMLILEQRGVGISDLPARMLEPSEPIGPMEF